MMALFPTGFKPSINSRRYCPIWLRPSFSPSQKFLVKVGETGEHITRNECKVLVFVIVFCVYVFGLFFFYFLHRFDYRFIQIDHYRFHLLCDIDTESRRRLSFPIFKKNSRKRNDEGGSERSPPVLWWSLVSSCWLSIHKPPHLFYQKKKRKKKKRKELMGLGFRHKQKTPLGVVGAFCRACCLRRWCHRISLLPNAGQTGHVSSSVFYLNYYWKLCTTVCVCVWWFIGKRRDSRFLPAVCLCVCWPVRLQRRRHTNKGKGEEEEEEEACVDPPVPLTAISFRSTPRPFGTPVLRVSRLFDSSGEKDNEEKVSVVQRRWWSRNFRSSGRRRRRQLICRCAIPSASPITIITITAKGSDFRKRRNLRRLRKQKPSRPGRFWNKRPVRLPLRRLQRLRPARRPRGSTPLKCWECPTRTRRPCWPPWRSSPELAQVSWLATFSTLRDGIRPSTTDTLCSARTTKRPTRLRRP